MSRVRAESDSAQETHKAELAYEDGVRYSRYQYEYFAGMDHPE